MDLDFNPKQIDVSTQSQDVTCTIAATDVGTGIGFVDCTFKGPSGQSWGCPHSHHRPVMYSTEYGAVSLRSLKAQRRAFGRSS